MKVVPALVLALLLAAPATLANESCGSGGPVSLLILQSGQKVHELARSLGVQAVHVDAKTVILVDGRVITADVAAAGEHLNRLGWSERPIQVVATMTKTRRVRPRRIG